MKEMYSRAPSAHQLSLLLVETRSKDAHLCNEYQLLNKVIILNQYLHIDSWLAAFTQVKHYLYQTEIPKTRN